MLRSEERGLLLVAAVLAMLPASAALATNAPATAARAVRVEATFRVARTSECTFEPPPQKMVVEVTIHTNLGEAQSTHLRRRGLQVDRAQLARRRVPGYDEAVAAHPLRLVERGIRAADELLGRLAAVPAHDPGRHGLVAGHHGAEPFDDVLRVLETTPRKRDAELIAAVAREDVALSKLPPPRRRALLLQQVAGLVSPVVGGVVENVGVAHSEDV